MTISPKKVAVVATGLIALVIVTMAAFLANDSRGPQQVVVEPSPIASPTAEPSFSPLPATHEKVAQQDPQDTNPVLIKLPRSTPYWYLVVAGRESNRYVLEATVYYQRGEDPARKISEQRPHIEHYITGIGQPAGTYELRLKGQVVIKD